MVIEKELIQQQLIENYSNENSSNASGYKSLVTQHNIHLTKRKLVEFQC